MYYYFSIDYNIITYSCIIIRDITTTCVIRAANIAQTKLIYYKLRNKQKMWSVTPHLGRLENCIDSNSVSR